MAETDSRSSMPEGAQDVVAIIDELLAQAVAVGASDVHFEPTAGNMQVRFRLDGVLKTIEGLPRSVAENIIARLKVLGGLLTYRTDIPQEGRIASPGGSGLQDKRLAIFPTIHGQRAVVRIFHEDRSLSDLSSLGLPPVIQATMERIAQQNQGVLLMTGPAGSGKSTTLAAIVRHILERFGGRSVVTLEDPVERHLAGATQVQIGRSAEMTFPTALRSLLRQDPEVLMIGEIRDAQTARIAIEAGLTGHLLLSTMHSGSPASALLRLLEMGVEAYQVTSSVSAVINQRLLRRLCLACRGRDTNCPRCLGTGFSGRALIAEMIQLDGDLRKALLAKADIDTLRDILARKGHMNLLQNGMHLVQTGVTTREELLRVCGRSDDGEN
ncbi:MAG: GspE/PulE family protein [Planctomycetaceae bacterium]|nr:GspE/PulE family protein [Planctomycetaceae bacterium]